MPSMWSGLIGAMAKGAEGYQTGANEEADKRTKAAMLLHAQQRQDAMDQEKMAMDRATNAAKGIDMGGASVAVDPVAAPPAPAPFDPSLLSAGSSSPSSLATPPALGGVPHVRVVEAGPSYDPANDRSITAIDARNQGTMDRLAKSLDSKESEGAANRDSRESIADANRKSAETRASVRAGLQGAMGGRPVTGTARLQHIMGAAKTYMKPKYLGGLGLNPDEAKRRATEDVDSVIASYGGKPDVPAAPAASPPLSPMFKQGNDPGGDVDFSAPSAAGVTFPKGRAQQQAVDPTVALAVKRIKGGGATLEQLMASKKSDAYKAAVRAALGAP